LNNENVVHIYNEVLFSHKKEGNYVICRKLDRTGDDHVKKDKPSSERQITHVFTHMRNLDLKNIYDKIVKG
jgi:hypothetical protein